MNESLIATLQARRTEIRARWEALLRIEQVKTPLANPDTLVHLFDHTLADIFDALHTGRFTTPAPQPRCPCGRHPLLAYFAAGEQSLLETLILAQAGTPDADAVRRAAELAELKLVVRSMAAQEIEVFNGVCQHRPARSGTG